MKRNSITIILLVLFGNIHAQQAFTNTGNLQIHTGAFVTGFGNFLNTSTGALVNNGILYVRGNAGSDQVSMSIGTGTLHLNGTGNQSVHGTQDFRTFNLVTNNSAGISLNNNLSVSGTHTFTNGIITSSATPNYLIYQAGSSYSGDADSRHVNGWVKKIGNTNFSFPVGNGTFLRKASIELLSGSLEFNARYSAPTVLPTNVQSPLVIADANEYWIINRVDASGSARIQLNWDQSKVLFPPYILDAVRVAYFTGGLWTDQGGLATGNVATTGDITSNSMSAFGSFTFASNDFMVPLQFLGITAQRKSGYNLVEWKAVNAVHTDHFEIERSEDGVHFTRIGKSSSYNSPLVLLYSFNDTRLMPGVLWYRIKSVDKEGKFVLSPVVSVNDVPQSNYSMYVLNNPARGSIHLFAPESFKGISDYLITSASGQLVQKGTLKANGPGNVYIKLSSGISQGVYILNVKNGSQSFRERILVRQ